MLDHSRCLDGKNRFHPTEKIPRHPIRAAEIDAHVAAVFKAIDATVLKELMKDEVKESEVEGAVSIDRNPAQSGWWNKVPVKKEGGRV